MTIGKSHLKRLKHENSNSNLLERADGGSQKLQLRCESIWSSSGQPTARFEIISLSHKLLAVAVF